MVCWAWMTPDVQEETGCWPKKGGRVEAISGSLKWGDVWVWGCWALGRKPELRLEAQHLGRSCTGTGVWQESGDSWEGARGTRMPLLPGTCPQAPPTFGPNPINTPGEAAEKPYCPVPIPQTHKSIPSREDLAQATKSLLCLSE